MLVHRYFLPDTPTYAHMLGAIADEASRMAPTIVVTGDVPYRSDTKFDRRRMRADGVAVVRVRLVSERRLRGVAKIINGPLFALKAATQVVRLATGGVVMAATTPPIVVALASAAASRLVGAQFVYHNQDIFPENSQERSGRLRGSLFSAIRRLDTYVGQLSARVVVLSEDMRSLWIDRGLDPKKLVINNNFVTETFRGQPSLPVERTCREKKRHGDLVRVVYIGNIGPLQDLDRSLKALANSGTCEVEVFGEGRSLIPLQEMALDHVHFHGPIPSQEASERLMDADLGLVSLRPGVERAAYPSKVVTLLESGIPILAYVSPSSALAREIIDNGLGLVPGDTSTAETRRALVGFSNLSALERQAMSLRCREYSRHFSQDNALLRWRALFSGLIAREGRVR